MHDKYTPSLGSRQTHIKNLKLALQTYQARRVALEQVAQQDLEGSEDDSDGGGGSVVQVHCPHSSAQCTSSTRVVRTVGHSAQVSGAIR